MTLQAPALADPHGVLVFLADPERRWVVVTADCADVMRALPDGAVDHVVADPPYDEKTHAGMMSAKTSKSNHRTTGPANRPHMVCLDFAPLDDVADLVAEQLRVARRWVVDFCTLEMLAAYRDAAGPKRYVRGGIWRPRNPAPQFSGDRTGQACDAFAVMHRPGRKRWNGGGKAAFYEVLVEHADRVHPTQKSLRGMMEMLADFTDQGDVVLDTHCGSGTTGVACLRLGRRFVGVEVDHAMAAVAVERLDAECRGGLSITAARAGQEPLFG